MRCFICDVGLTNVHYNRDHQDFDPCPTCLEVIGEVFADEPPVDDSEDASDDITESDLDLLIAELEGRIDVV